MIAERVILTGNLLEGYVEVKMKYNIIRYARPCMSASVFSLPLGQWVEKYGEYFWGFVTYEEGRKEDLILLGVLPKDGKEFPEEGKVDKHYFYSEKFRIFMDDSANTFSVDSLADGRINLGSVDADHPAVLGDFLKEILEELIDALKGAKTKTSIGPQSFMTITQLKLSNIKGKLDKILSKQTFLEK